MTNNGNASNKLPPLTQETAKAVWNRLSPADRRAVEEIIQAFPSQPTMVRLLISKATGLLKTIGGTKNRVAIVGPTNVGKSTLYNQLISRKEDRAEVSPLPGTTRRNQQADAGLFSIVDTPGADAVGEAGAQEQERALSAAAEADFLIILFDAIQGIKRTEIELYDRLVALGKPYLVALNKIDLVRSDRRQVIEGAAETLHLDPSQVLPVVAKTGEGVSDIVVAIALTEPGIVAALGRALPQYRWQLAWRTIVSAASASAAIALTPLPVVDFIPLVAAQSVMVLSIARIYNYEITLQRARELVLTLGLGLLGRRLFQELVKVGGIPGWLLSAAIAASTTVVMGYASSIWFETGERVSNETMKRITNDLTRQILEALRGLGKRRPDQKSLRETIEETLQKMPLNKDRTKFEEPIPPARDSHAGQPDQQTPPE